MFDIGFSELFVIGIVALIVIGPERLPKVARTAGHLFGRMQRYVNDVKADINREMELDELRKMKTQFESAAREVETSVSREVNAVSSEVQAAQDAFATQATSSEPASAEPPSTPAPAASPAPAPGAPGDAAPRIPANP
jgi:sec-independent protein translocase protein TatB